MNKNRLVLWGAFVAFLVLTIFIVSDNIATHGLLETETEANVAPEIGVWKIELNGIDITTQKVLTVDDLVYEVNNNVEPGYFAPGTSATYEIIVDAKDTDVSVRYDITMDVSALADHPNMHFAIKANGDEIEDKEGTYSGVIPLSSIIDKETVNIFISLVWDESDDYIESDNSLIGVVEPFQIPITIKFSQYLGESL